MSHSHSREEIGRTDGDYVEMQEEDANHTHAEVRAYLAAMKKAADHVTRWKDAIPERYSGMVELLKTTQEGMAGGLDSDAFKSEQMQVLGSTGACLMAYEYSRATTCDTGGVAVPPEPKGH